jgi:hypothetical protein
MTERFRVMTKRDATTAGYYEMGQWEEEYDGILLDFKDPQNPKFVASDNSEPEDVSFYRDLAWVPKLLNAVANGE